MPKNRLCSAIGDKAEQQSAPNNLLLAHPAW
jgi:hypothetical protein